MRSPGGQFDPWLPIEEIAALGLDLSSKELLQSAMAHGIARERDAIVAGSGMDVLEAIATCIRHRLLIPEWLGEIYLRRLRAVTGHEAGSWDHPLAFGQPFPKGAHLARLKKDSRAGPIVYAAVRQILKDNPSRALDEELFEEVAARFKKNVKALGRSECQRLYYQFAPRLDPIFGPLPGKSKKLAVIRKPK